MIPEILIVAKTVKRILLCTLLQGINMYSVSFCVKSVDRSESTDNEFSPFKNLSSLEDILKWGAPI